MNSIINNESQMKKCLGYTPEYKKEYNKIYYSNNKDKHIKTPEQQEKLRMDKKQYYLLNKDKFKVKNHLYRLSHNKNEELKI